MKRDDLITRLLKVHPYYWAVTITEARYSATMKTISRAGAKRCCVGVGDNILVLMTDPVIDGAKPLIGNSLTRAIESALECDYYHRRRQVRSSQGLFPPARPANDMVHIKRKFAVDWSLEEVINLLEAHGIYRTQGNYMRAVHSDTRLEDVFDLIPTMRMWQE